MFEDKTVLILGAGASRPYGLPTSAELRDLLLGDVRAFEVLRKLEFSVINDYEKRLVECGFRHPNQLKDFRETFFGAQRVSIDAFIGGRAEADNAGSFATFARNAIAHTVLFCEREEKLDGDWYQWLLEFLISRGKDFPRDILSVVTFNYDRSLERYLLRAFQHSFALREDVAAEMVDRIEVVHVYGSAGPLPIPKLKVAGVPFGDLEYREYAAKFISLVSPRSPPETQRRVRELIAEARRLIFVGFGFWRENLDVLVDAETAASWHNKRVFASCAGLPRSTQIEVDSRLGYVAGSERQPLINWGGENENAWQFVTKYSLNY